MTHAPALPPQTEYKLLKIVLDDSKDNLSIVRKDVATTPLVPTKKAAPQQIVAALAFSILGVNVSHLCSAGKVFKWPLNSLAAATATAFKNDSGAVGHAAHVLRSFVHNSDVAKHGQVQKNNVADYTCDLNNEQEDEDVISFAKILGGKQIVIVHNTSTTEAKEKFILLNNSINGNNKSLTTVYGYDSGGQIHLFNGKQGSTDICYIKIYLKPLHTVILKNY